MQRKDTHPSWIELTIFTVVFAFFAYSAHKLFFPLPPQAHSPLARGRDPAEDPQKNDSRNPASVESVSPLHQEVTQNILKVGCIPEANKSFQTNYSYLRLSGELCEKGGRRLIDGSARNKDTGAEITIYLDRPTKTVASNFFNVEPGKNTILLEFMLANGRKESTELEIERLDQND